MTRLFLLEGVHGYHGAGRGAGVRFLPTRRSRFIAGKAGVRFFFRGSGVQACFDGSDLLKLKAYANDPVEPLILSFLVVAERPDFHNYTALPAVPEGQLPVGSNRPGGEASPLLSGKPFGTESARGLRSLMAAGVCTGEELRMSPVALALLDYSGESGCGLLEEALNGQPQAYALHFESRKTFWRYFIPCHGDPTELAIEDACGDVAFHFSGMTTTESRQPYARFVSDRPVVLHGSATGCYQLKSKASGRCRTLLKALPNAPSDPLHCMDTDSGRAFVSDIFVHHYVHGR